MIKLTVDEVLLLHKKLLAATGGSPGLRDRGLKKSNCLSRRQFRRKCDNENQGCFLCQAL